MLALICYSNGKSPLTKSLWMLLYNYVYSVNFLLCIPTLNVTENFKKAVPENNILKGKLKKIPQNWPQEVKSSSLICNNNKFFKYNLTNLTWRSKILLIYVVALALHLQSVLICIHIAQRQCLCLGFFMSQLSIIIL